MAGITIRIPNDRHERLRQLARRRGISVNKLVKEFLMTGLAQFDAELRFRSVANRGDPNRALAILDKAAAALGPRS